MQNFGAQPWTGFIFPKLTSAERICEKRCCAPRFSTAPNWRMPFLYPPTRLEHAVLSFANLAQTDLSSARLGEANLTGAIFKGTILLDADLKKTDLRGAFFTGAILRGAELDGANLSGADLRGALGITSQQVCSALHGRL